MRTCEGKHTLKHVFYGMERCQELELENNMGSAFNIYTLEIKANLSLHSWKYPTVWCSSADLQHIILNILG